MPDPQKVARLSKRLAQHRWDDDRWTTAHALHDYHPDCAICRGDVERIVGAGLHHLAQPSL